MASTTDRTTADAESLIAQGEPTVDVASDTAAVMQGAMEPLRRPAAKAAVVVGIAIVVAIVATGLLSRAQHRDPAPSQP
jgi:hypothetical protein